MKCCKMGPGPYTKIPFDKWIFTLTPYKLYNHMCENYDETTEKCKLWGTPELPIGCEIYICTNRTFTEEELEHIKKRTDEYVDGLGKGKYKGFK